MLQRDGVVMMVMKVLVMMVMMMIPMNLNLMTVMMATIPPPPPGRNFPDRFLPAGELSLCVCFPPRRGGGVFLRSSPQS
jgi:hypothetical protein